MSTILNKNALGQKYLKADQIEFDDCVMIRCQPLLNDILIELNFSLVEEQEYDSRSRTQEMKYKLEDLLITMTIGHDKYDYPTYISLEVDGFVLTFRKEYNLAEKINHMIDLVRGHWKK